MAGDPVGAPGLPGHLISPAGARSMADQTTYNGGINFPIQRLTSALTNDRFPHIDEETLST